MIQLKPEPYNQFVCPRCASEKPVVLDVLFTGMHTAADCECQTCHLKFYHALPVSHTVDYPVAIEKESRVIHHDSGGIHWYTELLTKALRDLKQDPVVIRKKVFKEYKQVVVLNTLDFLYGHTLLKLYNAQHHIDHNPDLGLVLIIPKAFEWLVPEGCAEVWIVELKMSQLANSYDAIQKFVSEEFKRFDTVFLSYAYSHPELNAIDMKRFTGIAPFNLEEFTRKKTCITFVLREDRWWFTSKLDYWLYRVGRKTKQLSWVGKILTRRQNSLAKRTMKQIGKDIPAVEFYVAGLGGTGNFQGYASDKRSTRIDESVEKMWCELYAQSHIVIGAHGSNMLLPTAFAAACVEILPEDRYGNIVQDIAVRYTDRQQLFMYRFADQYARPASVASKAVSILKYFEAYTNNMCRNRYQA